MKRSQKKKSDIDRSVYKRNGFIDPLGRAGDYVLGLKNIAYVNSVLKINMRRFGFAIKSQTPLSVMNVLEKHLYDEMYFEPRFGRIMPGLLRVAFMDDLDESHSVKASEILKKSKRSTSDLIKVVNAAAISEMTELMLTECKLQKHYDEELNKPFIERWMDYDRTDNYVVHKQTPKTYIPRVFVLKDKDGNIMDPF